MAAPIVLGVLIDQHLDAVETAHLEGLAAGLRNAPLDRPVELDVERTEALPEGTSKALSDGFDALVARGAVAIVGPGVTDNALLACRLADRHEVVCLNWSGNENTRSRFCFQFQVGSLEEEALVLARELSRRGIDRVAVIYDRSSIGDAYFDWFRARSRSAGIAIVSAIDISPVATDTREEMSRTLAAGPDALVYLGLGHSAVAVAEALPASAGELPVFTNTALMYGHMYAERRPAWNNWVYIDMFSDHNPLLQQARQTSPEDWQNNPIGICSYDMGALMGNAFAVARDLNPVSILAAMHRVKQLPALCGNAGTVMTVGPWDRAVLKGDYLVLRSWRDGVSVEAADAS
jgi:ABC-type branched-subunit amino acid transport system substrate-binding protein